MIIQESSLRIKDNSSLLFINVLFLFLQYYKTELRTIIVLRYSALPVQNTDQSNEHTKENVFEYNFNKDTRTNLRMSAHKQ